MGVINVWIVRSVSVTFLHDRNILIVAGVAPAGVVVSLKLLNGRRLRGNVTSAVFFSFLR